eukprot:6186851-Pleurochrysis_carterae.AAC.6
MPRQYQPTVQYPIFEQWAKQYKVTCSTDTIPSYGLDATIWLRVNTRLFCPHGTLAISIPASDTRGRGRSREWFTPPASGAATRDSPHGCGAKRVRANVSAADAQGSSTTDSRNELQIPPRSHRSKLELGQLLRTVCAYGSSGHE